MADTQEKRLNTNANLTVNETKPEDDTQQDQAAKHLSGYAVVFNSPSKDLGGFKEVIAPDAFNGVDLSDVYLVNNHDMSQVLASTKAGTLKLDVDEKGLHFEADLTETTTADDVYKNVEAGNLSAMSFSFISAEDGDEFSKDDDGQVIRTIKAVKSLFDVSTVAIPAYDDTNVAVAKRSYTAWLAAQQEKQISEDTEKKEDNDLKKTIDAAQTETRSYEDYIRSHGEQRDGVTTTTAGVVVPTQVINDVMDLKHAEYDLAQYVTVKQVGTPVGTYPIALTNESTLATKEEAAEIGDIDASLFKGVDYKVATRAGKIFLTNEIVEDSEVDIVAEIKAQLKKLVRNTNNAEIVKLFTADDSKFAKVQASTLDDLKHVFNVDLDPALALSVITNQDGYNYLDTLKDSEGRYLLQPSVTAPTGKQLFGAQVIVVSNKLLATPASGAFPLVIGDLAQSVFVAQKNEVETNWQVFDNYSQGLAVVIRNDFEVIDDKAAEYVEIAPAAATATGQTTDPKAA
ncbi:phage major capsid protein [Lacticaseibacillus jixiensis]|uniref:phage major capsid protein n=1 Tax=Lacticaseibacillus jixiensis TaxID=3231926 RepID=UPI0036F26E38